MLSTSAGSPDIGDVAFLRLKFCSAPTISSHRKTFFAIVRIFV